MRIREVLSITAAVVGLVVLFYLMYHELADTDGDGLSDQIAPTEVQVTNSAGRQDPLLGIDYTALSRQDNFALFGLDENMVEDAMRYIRQHDTVSKRQTVRRILESESTDRTYVQAVLCGTTNDQRPRYGALQFLVRSEQGMRFTMDIRDIPSNLAPQEWASTSAWADVYREIELVGSLREPDATLMGIAAIMEGEEERVLEVIEPWGRQGGSDWSWEQVSDTNPGVAEQVIKYFALFHFVAEMAHGDDGICEDY